MVGAFFGLRVIPIGCESSPSNREHSKSKKAPTTGDHYHYHGMILTFVVSLKRARRPCLVKYQFDRTIAVESDLLVSDLSTVLFSQMVEKTDAVDVSGTSEFDSTARFRVKNKLFDKTPP